jgi:hypothetical protein
MNLTIAAKICGIVGFVILVSFVGIILAYNDEEAPKNCLNKLKGWITRKVEGHRHLEWLGKPKAMTKLLLWTGFGLGLFSLIVLLLQS